MEPTEDLFLCYTTFSDWCNSHSHLIPFLSLIGNDFLLSANSHSQTFLERRAALHNRMIKALSEFLCTLKSRTSDLIAEIEASQGVKIVIPPLIYDHQRGNVLCRMMAHFQAQLFDANTSMLSHEMFLLEDQKSDTGSLLSLFKSSIVPSDLAISIVPSFMVMQRSDVPPSIVQTLAQTRMALSVISREMAIFALPVWSSDFPLFLRVLILELEANRAPGMSYYKVVPSEVSLSRCLTNSMPALSRHYPTIDRCPVRELPVVIGQVIDAIIADNLHDGTKNESQIAQFVLFRNIFDICYLRRKDMWPKADPDLFEKVVKLSRIPCTRFNIREYLVATPLDPAESIRDYVLNDPSLRRIAEMLAGVTFATNPFDALYEVSLVLLDIKSFAVANRNSRLTEAPEIALSFDDGFSLFCAVFLGCDIVDIAALNAFVVQPAGKPLSSAFEYSQLILESLEVHIRHIDIDALANR